MAGVERRWFFRLAAIGIAGMLAAACGEDGSVPDGAMSADQPRVVSSMEAEPEMPVTTLTTTTPVTTMPVTSVSATSVSATTPVDPTAATASLVPLPTVPFDRLAGWPRPPEQPIPVDHVPLLFPTAGIQAVGLPLRSSFSPDSDIVGTMSDRGGVGSIYTQVFADAEHDVVFTVSTEIDGPDDLTPAGDRRPVTIEGWDQAYATVARPVDPDGRPVPVVGPGQPVRVVATDPSGRVMLVGTGLDDDAAIAIIAGMQRVPSGPGWEFTAVMDGLVEINGGWGTGTGAAGLRWLSWYDSDSTIVEMITSPQLPQVIGVALGTTFDEVDINGTTGWARIDDLRSDVVWSPDGTNIVVLGVTDAAGIDGVSIARSVGRVDEDTYDNSTTPDPPAWLDDGCNSLFC